MRRLPVLATLLVAASILTMIGLGIWQIRRAEWKADLLATYQAAQQLPVLDLDPLLDGEAVLPPIAFRRVLVTCRAPDMAPRVRAGRNSDDVPGQAYLLPCRPGAPGLAGRLVVNAGWSRRPDAVRRLSLDGIVAGRLGAVESEGPVVLTAAEPLPPLAPSRAPGIESIPNNHRLYAFQWFFFAAAAGVIFVLALKRRREEDGLPPVPPGSEEH